MFLINLIPMHVLVLMVTGRFSHRIYVAYSTLYCVGTVLSMQISFVGFQPVQSSEHMMVSTVFIFNKNESHALTTGVKNIQIQNQPFNLCQN